MKKAFITGDNAGLISELKEFLKNKFEFENSASQKTEIAFEVTNYDRDLKFKNLNDIENHVPENAVIISSSLCIPLSQQLRFVKKVNRLFGVGIYPTFSSAKNIEVTKSNLTSPELTNVITDIFENSIWVEDRTGLINLRIISLIINEAYLVLQEKTADAKDIDIAMKLGTNYPYGPIEWSERIGLDLIYNILQSMYNEYGDDRYRITPLLKERYLEYSVLKNKN
ncbi:MAG TPA: 3-hydroxyacyl-CoA dehydrogenase family protein [Ignavibacteria bacterium]|nr:3-hydroxyacyl-CoA dehydrogenase family protein [Ignavibacteria bacterium]